MNLPYKIYLRLKPIIPQAVLFRLSLSYQRAMNKIRYGDQWFPLVISIEANKHCNRTCYYCPQSVEPTNIEFVKEDVFEQFLNRLVEINWKGMVAFQFFGEPLLNKNLESYVRRAKQRLPRCLPILVSNGDALTEARLASLIADGMDRFNITRHPKGTKENPVYDPKWDARMTDLMAKYPRHLFVRTIEGIPLQNRQGLVSPKIAHDFSKGCDVASCQLTVDIEGRYVFCCCDYEKRHFLGNIFKDSILKAWANPKYVEARKSVRNAKPVLDVCEACFTGKPIGKQ